jgi:hypothetical protein
MSLVSCLSLIGCLCALAGCCHRLRAQMASPPPPAALTAERPTSKVACDACGGLWAAHGVAQIESCVCRTKDAGKPCRDGADCSGSCIADEKKFEIVQPGPPPRGFYLGQCSIYDTTFGCFKVIPAGIRSKPPQLEEDAAEAICVD